MEIVDTTKFAIGLVFALVGAAVLILSRGTPGFNQRKQAGALMIVGALVFLGVGLGLIDF